MSAARRRWAAELLHIWFHTLGPRDWYAKSDATDAMLRRRFDSDLNALASCAACAFLGDPQTALASVLLFDQIPRNLYRDKCRAFAFDPLARAICKSAIARGWHRQMRPAGRQFLGMPLMHSEHIADQRASLVYFREFARSSALPFARSHYAMIARFGRFPHRNRVLGRKSSAAETRAIAAGFAW